MRKFNDNQLAGENLMDLVPATSERIRESVLFADISEPFSLQAPDMTGFLALVSFNGARELFMKPDLPGADRGAALAFAEFVPTDPLYASQWHLSNPGAGLFDINVEAAWDDYTGSGVQVTVFDNGFDYVHLDLAANYLTAIDYDYTSIDFDPAPGAGDDHGTAVMGIIGAVEGNSEGGVGVAFDASLVGYRGFALGAANSADEISDAAGIGDGIGNTNGDAFGTDVINVSGGYGSTVFFGSAALGDALMALEAISEFGRSGLGTIYVKSSGNSRAAANSTAREEGTAEMFDSTSFSINVAALRQDGWVTFYSTPGANVLVSAFADNLDNSGGITTTDRSGGVGYDPGDYTSGFNGTSSAAPQVAGVVALMLEANADLGWRDVQNILSISARNVGSEVDTAANTGGPGGGSFEQSTQGSGATWFWNAADDWNGGGRHFSNDYGYGLVDATAAVRLAESWTTSNATFNRASTFEDWGAAPVVFDDDIETFIITETEAIRIEHVMVDINFDHTFLADMELYLISPSGTEVQLIADTGDSGDFAGRWQFGTTAFMGEMSAGDWTFIAVDDAAGDTFTITDVDLYTWGSALSDDKTFFFTNEYSDYSGVAGHTETSFDGGATGTDTINAVAVSSDTTIDLEFGMGSIDGVTVSGIVDVENVYTGDGADTIIGDSDVNSLYGGRGDDMIAGGSGSDFIFGGRGVDVLNGDSGLDDLFGGDGDDTLNGGFGNDVLYGDGGNDTINGGSQDDMIFGGNGADTISGGNQDDTIDGGGGIDTINGNNGVDTISGGGGSDILRGGQGDDVINGNAGHDDILGNNQQDTLYGDAGNDTIGGGGGNDDLFGGADNDDLTGNSGQDELYGGDGDDTLSGNAGGDDLFGGDGADTLNGGGGNDDMTGGSGADIFVFTTGFRVDRIKDFEDGTDLIDVSGHSSWSNFADILADATQVGLNVIIQVNPNNRMVIENFDLADLDAGDFIF